jgi:hypothetical protein
MNGKAIMEIVSWTIIAALGVLIVMNASKFAIAISSITGFWGNETAMFTGANYTSSGFGTQQKAKVSA